MGKVGSNEDSGQADADLNCPEARPKRHPQHPARGRRPRRCRGWLTLPGVLPSHPLGSAWPPADPVLVHAPPGIPWPVCLPAALCHNGLGCAPVGAGAASAQRGWFWHSSPVFECPRLLLPRGSGEQSCHHDVVHTCCAHGVARGAPWVRREPQVRPLLQSRLCPAAWGASRPQGLWHRVARHPAPVP